VGRGQSFIALYNDHGDRFTLVCLDTLSGRELWRSEVWARGGENFGGPGSGPGPYHEASLIVKENEIAVAGYCLGAVYLEKFDRRTGKAILRFCTDYWWQDNDE